MFSFQRFPFLRFTFFFALGIVARHYLGTSILLPPLFILFLFAAYLALLIQSQRFQQLLALLSFVILFSLGAHRLELFKIPAIELPESIAYQARIIEEPQEKKNSIRTVLELSGLKTEKGWQTVEARVNAYLAKDSLSALLTYGDELLVYGRPEPTDPPSNPGEFNYKNYLTYQNIHFQQFVGSDYAVGGHQVPNPIVELALKQRERLRGVFKEYMTDDRALAIVQALVLGVKEDLDNELIASFSATGAMHVLAVSGLHVGIIYAIVFYALQYLRLNRRKYRWLMAGISIGVLWSYALITGLSPSVLRAVTMFSFVALGRALFRSGNIYNTLALSAMVLLVFNPYLIMSVGFQLSYLAVFGIVFLHPKLYALLVIENKILDKVWSITCVSIAAQLATGPLSLLYFHQFPSYFLVSNLFIIPAAFVILISGLVLLLLAFAPFLADLWGQALTAFVKGITWAVETVSRFPGSTIEGVYLSILDTWLLYGLLTSLVLYFLYRKLEWLRVTLVLSFALAGSQIFHFHEFAESSEIAILDVNRGTVIDFRKGFQGKVLADSAFLSDEESQQFNLFGKRLLSGVSQKPEKDVLNFPRQALPFGELMVFEGKSVFWLKEDMSASVMDSTELKIDYLIISNNAIRSFSDLPDFLKAEKVILDNSNSRFRTTDLSESFKAHQIHVHQIGSNGYFSSLWKK